MRVNYETKHTCRGWVELKANLHRKILTEREKLGRGTSELG